MDTTKITISIPATGDQIPAQIVGGKIEFIDAAYGVAREYGSDFHADMLAHIHQRIIGGASGGTFTSGANYLGWGIEVA